MSPDGPGPEDRLLQGLQGLVLHLHAIAGDLPAETPVRDSLERWLASAEQLVEQGCADGAADSRGRPGGAVARLMGLADMRPLPPGAVPAPLSLRLQVGPSPSPLRPGVQQSLSQVACDQARRARLDAGATRILVQLHATPEALSLRVRDNGSWPSGLQGGEGVKAWASGCSRLGALARVWHWPRRGAEWQLRLPARQAYETGSSERRPGTSAPA